MSSNYIHVLDKQTDLLVGVLDPESEGNGYWAAEHVDSSLNFETFDFIASGSSDVSPFLTGENRVLISGDEPDTWKEFIIWHTHREGGIIEVKANGSYTEIAKDRVVLPMVQENLKAVDGLNVALSESEWKVGIVEGSATRKITIGEAIDAYQYLLRIASTFEMKLRFRVEIRGNQIVGRYVDLLYNIGNNLGKEIILGKDLIGVERDEMTDEIVTAMVVQGPEREDGTKLTITVEDLDARQRWGRGRHKWGYHQVESDNKGMQEPELTQYGRTALNKKINSVIRYTAEAVALEHIFGLSHERTLKGDKVRIKDTSYNPPLYLEARVVEIRRNPASKKLKKYVLGDFVEYTEEAVMAAFKKLQEEINKKLSEEEVLAIVDGRDIVKAAIPPSEPKLNLMWLDTSQFPNVIYRWDGAQWVKTSATLPAEIGAETPGGAQVKVEIMQLRLEAQNVVAVVREMGVDVTKMNSNTFLVGSPVLTTLNAANTVLSDRGTLLVNAINAAIADNLLTQPENTNIDTLRSNFRAAIDTIIRELRNAETEIVRVSANEVMAFGERKIFKGATVPDPTKVQNLDLWLDSRTNPPVWRQLINNVWTLLTRINLSDMQGKILETQVDNGFIKTPMIGANQVIAEHIAANTITSNMITTAGLDAGVIKFGSMTGITAEVGSAGMTAAGALGSSIRFWAGATILNRNTAPFRVQNDGKVIATNIDITGGSITGASARFGGTDNQYGTIAVYDAAGEVTAELNGEYGGFARLNVGYLDAPNKVEYADYRGKELNLYVTTQSVSGTLPNDANGGTAWTDALMTINEAIRRIPKNFEGNVRINLMNTHVYNENVFLAGYSGTGNIRLSAETGMANIRGNITVKQNTISFAMANIRFDCTSSAQAVAISQAHATMQNCIFNGRAGGTTFGVNVTGNGNAEAYDCEVWNVSTGFRAAYGGHIMVNGCRGMGSNYGMQGYGGGLMSGTGTAPSGGTANVTTGWGGMQTGSWNFPTPGTPPSPIASETSASFESRPDSGTWRTDAARWETSGVHSDKVSQGVNSGATYVGSWFYGTDVQATLQGKTIKAIRLSIQRFPLGTYSNQTIVIRPHTSATRPTGNVSVQSPSYSVSVAVGEVKTITLPTSFHAGFASGSYKGLSINGGQYVGMSRGTTLEVTYA